jgi:hypothetical protein
MPITCRMEQGCSPARSTIARKKSVIKASKGANEDIGEWVLVPAGRRLRDVEVVRVAAAFHRSRRCSILMGVRPQWFALVLAVAAVLACCAWAPWMLVDAAFPDNHVSLGFAPLWSSKFGDLPGARVDVHQLLIQIGFLTFVAALIGLARAIRRS